MNTIEDTVRAVLREDAATAPDGTHLLAGIRDREARLTAHRRRLAVSGAALAAAASVAATVAIGPIGDWWSSAPAGTQRPAPSSGAVPAPTFPLTPGRLPSGAYLTGYEWSGAAPSVSYLAPGLRSTIAIHVAARKQDLPLPASTPHTTYLGGASASWWPMRSGSGNDGVRVSWQRRPGQYVSVLIYGRIDEGAARSEALRIAARLADRTLTVPLPFRFDTALPGYRIRNVDDRSVVLGSTAGGDLNPAVRGSYRSGTAAPAGATRVLVGARDAWLTSNPDDQELSVPDGRGNSVVVQASRVLELSILERFAAGVTVADGTRPTSR